jgi:hypothetical protein
MQERSTLDQKSVIGGTTEGRWFISVTNTWDNQLTKRKFTFFESKHKSIVGWSCCFRPVEHVNKQNCFLHCQEKKKEEETRSYKCLQERGPNDLKPLKRPHLLNVPASFNSIKLQIQTIAKVCFFVFWKNIYPWWHYLWTYLCTCTCQDRVF